MFDVRPGYTMPGFGKSMTDKEFLQKTLDAVKRRRGLIHGELKDDKDRVCALGAFCLENEDNCVSSSLAKEIQDFNDSMPNAGLATRRLRMIKWLEKRLKGAP